MASGIVTAAVVAGAVIAAAVPLGTGLVGWGKIQGQQTAQDDRLRKLEDNQIRVSDLESGQAALAGEVGGLTKSVDRLVIKVDAVFFRPRPSRDFDAGLD